MTITEPIRIAVNEASEATRETQRTEMLLALVGLVDEVRTQYPAARTLTLEHSDQGPWLELTDYDALDEGQDLFDDENYASHLYTNGEGYLATRLEEIDGLAPYSLGSWGRSVKYVLDIEAFVACPLYADIVRSLT